MTTSKETYAVAVATGIAALAAAAYLAKKKRKSDDVAAPTKPTVYGFLPISPDADSSPACLKLVTFLKICRVDYDHKYFTDHEMKGSPRGKAPWMHWDRMNDGKPMGDSTLIMNALIRLDPKTFDIDSHLTSEQRAIGVAIKTMLEESTYWTGIINVRWLSDQFSETTVPTYFGNVPIPSLIKPFIMKQIRSKIVRDARGQGTVLLNNAERKEKFEMEVKALSDYLGEKKYIMGDKVSSFDATVFALIATLTQGTWKHEICDSVRKYQNLMSYADRMRKEFWPELLLSKEE